MVVVSGVLVALDVSCKNQRLPSVPSDEGSAAIYAAVTRQLATVDDTFGGNLNPPTLYIIRNTDDRAGNPGGQQSNSVSISSAVQAGITADLGDLPIDIVWIDRFEDAEFEDVPGSSVKGGGAIITLGNIYPQEDGSVQVAGSIYIANLAAGGTTYMLGKVGGGWEITGRTGVSWIS